MKRFRIDVAYDGRPFSGWQSQVSGDTIQDLLLAALTAICPAIGAVQGSGRTDAGVSASKQVAHFDVPVSWRMNGGEWQRALNSSLPKAIRIMACYEVSPEFHARFSAMEKEYHYRIATADVMSPLLVGLAWHQRQFPDPENLAEVLALYEGTHDFRAFSANRNDGFDAERDTNRTIFCADIVDSADEVLVLRFRGNGFLYKMVRFLVGSAVYCVNGRISRAGMEGLLKGVDSGEKAPFCAPPDGLSLENVTYPETFDHFCT
ncbi:tRNA pseudouridine(38-40) synthase TruA [Verrucomicrobiales bacterium BCK34]|nr:tRNA pseudouridine(38-40) synthase TruA [Verrucomicrobiales bacterium BCK34]